MGTRNASGQFIAGNTAATGKRGYKDRGRQLAKLFTDADLQQVYQALMGKAQQGDSTALSLICRYVAPPPKPTLNPTPFQLESGNPLQCASSILEAAAAGDLPADVARTLMDTVLGMQRIREVVELEERIASIETHLENAQ